MASGDDDYTERQKNEIEAIKAIYDREVNDLRKGGGFTWELPHFSIKLFPQRGSSYGQGPSEHQMSTNVELVVKFPPLYPSVVPEITIQSSKGLTTEETEQLKGKLVKLAKDSLGEVMILDMAQCVETYLFDHQKRPTVSFYDEMLERQKILEQKVNKVKTEQENKIKLALQEEIQKKQEALKEEVRKRKDLQLLLEAESTNLTLSTSPTTIAGAKGLGGVDSNVTNMKKSSRRTRTSSSRLSEGSYESDVNEIVTLEFVCAKSKRSFQRGEMLGSSERGSRMYAGMDCRNGNLVAIAEWDFYTKLDKKNRAPKSFGGISEGITTDNLLKQINQLEVEFKTLQKLEHSNLCSYYGIKCIEENSKICLYIAQEFLRGTTLQAYLQDNMTLDLGWIRNCANGILFGLEYLHSNNIVHRFLKDTSIFLDNFGEVKITDYGLERKITELYQSFNCVPEVPDKFALSIGRGAKKGDIYRFGVLILSLIKGEVVSSNPPEISALLPAELQDFLRKCLTTNENARHSASQLLEHAFLKLPIPRGEYFRFHKNQGDLGNGVDIHDDDGRDSRAEVQEFVSHVVKGHSRLQTEFEIMVWLGKGAFGDVLKVRNKLDGRIYAIKRIKLNPKNKLLNKKITREVKLLSQLNHENVVRYFNSWIETVVDFEPEETSDGTTTTTDPTNTNKIKNQQVHFEIENTTRRNSLGLPDNIEELAPASVGGIEQSWGTSKGQEECEESEEESEDEDNIFGTSFLCLANEDSDSDDVMFECSSSKNNTSKADSSEVSSSFRDQTQLAPSAPPIGHEMQFMYIQMEFCEKSTLRTAIDAGLSFDPERTWRLFREIVEGLVHIHQQGMIHRDLKPVNIFLDSHDSVKIGDFGLATGNILQRNPGEDGFTAKNESLMLDLKSVESPDESHTGQVGTHGYVAPELVQLEAKAVYNQKVDIYSLGIIFFEMIYHPVTTGMERVRLIAGLRQPEILFPTDFDEYLYPTHAYIARWLLQHDPTKRPTSNELLQSEYIPPPQMEETELHELFRHTLSNSQSKAYKYLMSSCFKQKFTSADEITYDLGTYEKSHFKFLPLVQKTKNIIANVFQYHGAVEFECPLLIPKSEVYENVETYVKLMTNSGYIVSLPHDLRVSFARYVASNAILNWKRYSIQKVYRERKVYGFHPRELYECAFDIVSTSQGSLLADAETLSTVFEIITQLPWLRNKPCTIQLGHTNLLKAILLHHNIDNNMHDHIRIILMGLKNEKHSKSQVQTRLVNLCLPEQFIALLFNLIEMEGPLVKVSNLLKGIIKKKNASASLIKEALHELEVLAGHVDAFGLKCNIIVSPTLVFGNNVYCGLIYQVACNLKKRKNRMVMDVIAAGGRYDALLHKFRNRLNVSDSKELKQYGVGISISLDKLICGMEGDEEVELRSFKSSVDVVICSFGHHSLNREKISLSREFWSIGISCISVDEPEALETVEEMCRDLGAPFLIILKDSELFGTIRIRYFEKDRVQEKKLLRSELIEYVKRTIRGNNMESTNELIKSEVPKINTNVFETNTMASLPAVGGGPTVNITFIVPDAKEKPSNLRKRQENQMMAHITETLSKLSKQKFVELVGLEVNNSMINTMASYFQVNDKDQFRKSVGEFLEKESRQRKYMKTICDGIFELLFEKRSNIIIIYGLIDNSYRVMF